MSEPLNLPCPICQSTATHRMHAAEIDSPEEVSFSYTFSPAHSKTFQVLRCDSCSHAFCGPIPSDIASHYRDVVDDEYLRHANSRDGSAESVLQTIHRYCPSGRILDVGCATGDFLVAAKRRGYHAEGLELSDWSSQIASDRGLVIHRDCLDTFALKHSAEYDVVTLWGVIEHFSNPRQEIQNISKILRPGGILVLWTGDVNSLPSLILKKRWWYWQGQHIQYFTKRSLKLLLSNAGLVPEAFKIYPFSASLETVSNSLRRYAARDFMLKLLAPLFRIKPNWYLRIPGEMFVIARKSSQ